MNNNQGSPFLQGIGSGCGFATALGCLAPMIGCGLLLAGLLFFSALMLRGCTPRPLQTPSAPSPDQQRRTRQAQEMATEVERLQAAVRENERAAEEWSRRPKVNPFAPTPELRQRIRELRKDGSRYSEPAQ